MVQFFLPNVIFFTSIVSTLQFHTSSISPAELVAKAKTPQQILDAISILPAPGTEKDHFQQYIHQKRRQTTATRALQRITKFLIGQSCKAERAEIVSSENFRHLINCAMNCLPDPPSSSTLNHYRDEAESYCDALRSLGSLVPFPLDLVQSTVNPLLANISSRIEKYATPSSISGLLVALNRLGMQPNQQILQKHDELHLPFKLICGLAKDVVSFKSIRAEVPFRTDTFTTIKGKVVTERRETCWMADSSVGGLAYSGKIMVPVPFTSSVIKVRDLIEKTTGTRYDCALINLYPDGECACKYHSDPDHGRLWARETLIVSIGETRRFNLREIANARAISDGSSEENPHSFHVSI